MKKNHLSTETLVFEIISAIAALFYMGLQVYYGIVYGAGAVRIVMNVLILILVYMGLTVTRSALTDCRARSVPERYADIRSAWWN